MRKIKTEKNIAIVLGSKGVNATGLIRSLGEKGFFVVFASTYSKIESKWVKAYLKLNGNKKAQFNMLYAFILSLPSKPAIFTVDDKYNLFLDENYKTLQDIAFIPHAKGNLKEISDKSVMSSLVLASGLNVPEFIKASLEEENISLEFPVMIKPYAGFAGSKGDITICYTEEDFKKTRQNLIEKGYKKVLVQRLLNGENQFEIGLMGISLPNGEVIIPCAIKKIRSYPMKRGSTSFAQIKNEFFGVDIASVKNFVLKTGYVGIFDIEMIIDNNLPYFIEINYRNGQYGYSVTKAGYNLPANWFNAMLEKPVEKVKKVDEIYYINEREDYLHVKEGLISKKEWKKDFKRASAFGMYNKGDNRPYIRQYLKFPDRIKIFIKKFFNTLKNLIVKEEWNVALRERGKDLLLTDDNGDNFKVIKNSFRYWCADPFIYSQGEKDYLFFEMYDRLKSKGVIGYRVIENGKIGKMKKAIECKKHLSFPFIFRDNNDIYIMPESSEEKDLKVFKAKSFPNCWEMEKCLLSDEKVCDTVIYKDYLLTMKLEENRELDGITMYKFNGDKLEKTKVNPIVTGAENSRLAGSIFSFKDKTYRVSQDCSNGYGIALNFNEINEINENEYKETLVKRIELKDISFKLNKKYRGIHTYNFNEKYEVIDVKKKLRPHFANFLNIFYRIFKIIGKIFKK